MSCNLLAQSIINSCSAVRGLSPNAWVLPYVGTKVEFTHPLLTAGDVQTVKTIFNENQKVFSKITAVKFSLNAGHDAVVSDVKSTSFSHYFSAVLKLNSSQRASLDKMDGIIVVIKDNNGKYLVIGAENGLWKTTQVQRANDNTGLITVEYASQEGVEETFEDYQLVSDIALSTWSIDYYLNETSHEIMLFSGAWHLESTAPFYYRTTGNSNKEDLYTDSWTYVPANTEINVSGYTEFIYDTIAGIIIT